MLTVGTNSFVTLDEADAYMVTRFGGDSWNTFTSETRESLLVTAFRWIVSLGVSTTSTATKVKWAQIELAWWIYNYLSEYEDREALIAGGVTQFRLSKWMEKLSEAGFPKRIEDLLAEDMGLGGYFPDWNRELEN
jgi:hypothetical protein